MLALTVADQSSRTSTARGHGADDDLYTATRSELLPPLRGVRLPCGFADGKREDRSQNAFHVVQPKLVG